MSKPYRKYDTYTYAEGRTAAGQLVSFTCASEDKDEAVKALEKFRTITNPVTRHVKSVDHGRNGQTTRFKILQHKYAGGGYPGNGGWIEALQIMNPPDSRHGLLLYQCWESECRSQTRFHEFASLPQLIVAFENSWGCGRTWQESGKIIASQDGFMRTADCVGLDPWFYAIGNQALHGDVALPNTCYDHPVWRPMQKYVVYPNSDAPDISTLLMVDHVTRRFGEWYRDKNEHHYIVLVFDSGVQVEFNENDAHPPVRPLREGELWIAEAMDKFRELLAGKTEHFEIPFTSGGLVKVNYRAPKGKASNLAGHYKIRYRTEDNKKARDTEGDFKPTPDCPTIEAWVKQQEEKSGKKAEIISCVRTGGLKRWEFDRKKWAGVYADPFRK